jgi:hypothetical protein
MIDSEFAMPMGDCFEGLLHEESRNLGLTPDQIRAWQLSKKRSRARIGVNKP